MRYVSFAADDKEAAMIDRLKRKLRDELDRRVSTKEAVLHAVGLALGHDVAGGR